jgi:hypothetical protein
MKGGYHETETDQPHPGFPVPRRLCRRSDPPGQPGPGGERHPAAANHKDGPSCLLQWLVIVTARLADGQTAVCSIQTGEAWEIFARDETHHYDNAGQAATLVRQYLEAQDFAVGKGILNPGVVMDNVVKASTDLWRFEDKKLVPND